MRIQATCTGVRSIQRTALSKPARSRSLLSFRSQRTGSYPSVRIREKSRSSENRDRSSRNRSAVPPTNAIDRDASLSCRERMMNA